MQYTELEVLGSTYRLGKIPALTQLHIMRRLLPALVAVGIRAEDLAKREGGAGFVDLMEPAVKIMGSMTDQDVNYVLFELLGAVTRKQGERFAAITNGQRLMFEDIDMPAMVRLAGGVLQENLGGFFALLPAGKLSPESSGTAGAASN
jgi:hypothetical protein